MAEVNRNFRTNIRECVVDGQVGYFHIWSDRTFALVEFADGIRPVDPERIKFQDYEHGCLCKQQEVYDSLMK